MAILKRTKSICFKMLEDVKKVVFWTNIIVQSIFLIFNGFSILKNIKQIPFMIVYCLIFIISIVSFTTFLATHLNKNTKAKKFKRILRTSKYFANSALIILNVCEMIKIGISDFNKILLIVSAISLFVQIFVELIRIFIEKYVGLLHNAFEMDLGILSKLDKVKEVKGNLFKIIDAPLEAIANKLEKKEIELSKQEQKIQNAMQDYDKHIKEKKKRDKEEAKKRSAEKAKKEKKEILQHLGTIKDHIFRKKKNETKESV